MSFTLHNYWWLLIWPCICLALLFAPRRADNLNGEIVIRWKWLPALVMAFPYALWTGFRNNAWGDTYAYRRMFDEAPITVANITEYLNTVAKDRGFIALMVVFKSVFGNRDILFFFIIACIQIICLVAVYRKYSSDFWLSFFLFVCSTDYISWMHNGMRQFLIVTLLFACIPLLLRKRYIAFCVIALILSLFHLTALFMIPIAIITQGKAWNIKTILFILLVILSVVYLDRFTGLLTAVMENTQYSVDISDLLSDSGANIYRVLFYSVPAIASFVFRKKINRMQDPVVNLSVNMSIAAAGFYIISYFTSGIYLGRLPIFFSLYNYILYPALIEIIFERRSGQLIKGILVMVYVFFFYYQMHTTWGMI